MESLIMRQSISIIAPKATVWDILVNPEKTKLYMFGCVPVSDWKPGSALLWQGEEDGNVVTFVKGNIIEIRPGDFLSYTVIDPNNTEIADLPENYLTVTYTLTEADGVTDWTVTQGDYATVAQGQRRWDDTQAQGGWTSILEAVRDLAEAE